MSSEPLVVVVGADGFVGGGLAAALPSRRVVYGPCRDGDVHVSRARDLLASADVVVNAHGFRVRPGCNYVDYQRSHEGATAAILPWLRNDALLVQISSASVLGRGRQLGNRTPPDPGSFPSPSYARAKLEEDLYLQRVAAERGIRVAYLRPAVVYSENGAGMVDTLLKLARRRVALRLYPRAAKHHLCNMRLLVDVARRVIARRDVAGLPPLVVADPYVVSNEELEAMVHAAVRRAAVAVPLPLPWMSGLLRHAFWSTNPKLDLRTRGEIFGVLHMDTVYDPSETFQLLGIDPAEYSLEKTLLPVIREGLRA